MGACSVGEKDGAWFLLAGGDCGAGSRQGRVGQQCLVQSTGSAWGSSALVLQKAFAHHTFPLERQLLQGCRASCRSAGCSAVWQGWVGAAGFRVAPKLARSIGLLGRSCWPGLWTCSPAPIEADYCCGTCLLVLPVLQGPGKHNMLEGVRMQCLPQPAAGQAQPPQVADALRV